MSVVQIQINNYDDINRKELTELIQDTQPGTATLVLKNTSGFAADDYILLGLPGSDGGEVVQILAVSDANTATLQSTTQLFHGQFELVTSLFGNQANLYRAANVTGLPPADAAFALVSPPSPEALQYDKSYTNLEDPNGDNTWWYKYTYLNSTTGAETLLSASSTARGLAVNYYCTIQQIRKAAGLFNNQFITGSDVDEKRQEAQSEVDAALAGTYTVPFQSPVPTMINGVTRLLAAGKLLTDNYGPNDGPMSADGESKIAEARNMLAKIDSKIFALTDYNGNSLVLSTALSTQSWPNKQTASLPNRAGGSHRNFAMGDVQGYGDRKY